MTNIGRIRFSWIISLMEMIFFLISWTHGWHLTVKFRIALLSFMDKERYKALLRFFTCFASIHLLAQVKVNKVGRLKDEIVLMPVTALIKIFRFLKLF